MVSLIYDFGGQPGGCVQKILPTCVRIFFILGIVSVRAVSMRSKRKWFRDGITIVKTAQQYFTGLSLLSTAFIKDIFLIRIFQFRRQVAYVCF